MKVLLLLAAGIYLGGCAAKPSEQSRGQPDLDTAPLAEIATATFAMG